jgi:hypothetical protein
MRKCVCCHRAVKSHRFRLMRLDTDELAVIHEECLDRWHGEIGKHLPGEWTTLGDIEVARARLFIKSLMAAGSET